MPDYLKLAREARQAFKQHALNAAKVAQLVLRMPALCDAIEAQAATIAKLQDTALYDAMSYAS